MAWSLSCECHVAIAGKTMATSSAHRRSGSAARWYPRARCRLSGARAGWRGSPPHAARCRRGCRRDGPAGSRAGASRPRGRGAIAGRPDRPRHEAAAAVRADIVQLGLDAIGAEGALVAADARLGRCRRQVLVAIFAVGPKLERHAPSRADDPLDAASSARKLRNRQTSSDQPVAGPGAPEHGSSLADESSAPASTRRRLHAAPCRGWRRLPALAPRRRVAGSRRRSGAGARPG